jgi:hypothetical protein
MAFLSESDDIPRLLTRGTSQVFRIGFFTDGSKTTPLIPKDPLRYPSYEILDPNGVAVQTGVLQADGGVGEYATTWTVANDAMLSNPNNRYQFKAFIVTNTNEQAEITHEFDVQDVVVTASEDRSQCILSLVSRELRVQIQRTERIDIANGGTMTLELILGSTSGKSVAIAPQGTGTVVTLDNGQIQEIEFGDSYLYYYTIPAGVLSQPNCAYVSLWSIRQNVAAAEETQFQLIRSVDGPILNMTVQLRQLIDKFQKQRGRVQAYEDSDLVEYLDRGLEIVNVTYPITAWQMSFIGGSQFNSFILLAAAWYGLNAQYLMEVDLGFSFSGQTVTLDYDHAPMLAEAINRFRDYLSDSVSPAKLGFIRATSSVGNFAGKPMGFRALNRFTFPMGTFSSGDIMQTLSNIGIL